jgi:hypothetical protein
MQFSKVELEPCLKLTMAAPKLSSPFGLWLSSRKSGKFPFVTMGVLDSHYNGERDCNAALKHLPNTT